MNSKNYQDAGQSYALAGAAIAILIFFAFFALVSFAMTILCLFALRKTLTLGSIVITPDEAKGFIGFGVGGMIVLPLAVTIGLAMLDYRTPESWSSFLMIAGYTVGSLGFGFHCAQAQTAKEEALLFAPPPPRPARTAAPEVHTPRAAQPFTYASWSDEESER